MVVGMSVVEKGSSRVVKQRRLGWGRGAGRGRGGGKGGNRKSVEITSQQEG